MATSTLQVHPQDNVIAALRDLAAGDLIKLNGESVELSENIPAKHKFAITDLEIGDHVIMYGVLVGKASQRIPKGSRISTVNTTHAAAEYRSSVESYEWEGPDISAFKGLTFDGYKRGDGQVGTMNYWLVVPLVFCENRNLAVIKEALLEKLGYAAPKSTKIDIDNLISLHREGADTETLLSAKLIKSSEEIKDQRVFENVDGIKFLSHQGGCGGTSEDAITLCRLLAAYVTHPNVAGATVLSLGCQHSQFSIMQDAIEEFSPGFDKPLFFLEQQASVSEPQFIEEAIKKTFVGLTMANKIEREACELSHLKLGLECGGSDGFSGISANPALGYTSDLLVSLGGSAILSEFPELNGVEQELINRCTNPEIAAKFARIMKAYSDRARAVGSGFENNPSPGNIKDGLITDAMKSAGAAKKGGTSPVTAVLDYTEQSKKKGLHLLCTPGNDVESTTGLAASGANIIVFTTGLGTPTGNPITPVIKLSSNNALNERMSDIIDFNAGEIILGNETLESIGHSLLMYIIEVASGKSTTHATRLSQDDFIPWKRGVSL